MHPEPSERPIPTRSSTPDDAVELIEFSGPDPGRRRASGTSRVRRRIRRNGRLSVGLFLATGVTTFLTGLHPGAIGGILEGVLTAPPYPIWLLQGRWGAAVLFSELIRFGGTPPGLDLTRILTSGAVYAACVLGILLAHEMGHFLASVRHRVPATFPFFIPLPFGPFGTMGAVILQDGSRADRRQLFDIAVAGPLAGLAVALPVTWYGVTQSTIATVGPGGGAYGNPLLLEWIVALVHRPLGPGEDIGLNAPLFAGWVGIFITALNLLPVGQFDGGHILYTLIGRKAHFVAYAVLISAVSWMFYTVAFEGRPPSYVLIVLLLLVFGPKHPPTADDAVPLGLARTLIGWLTLAFFVIGFTPTPII